MEAAPLLGPESPSDSCGKLRPLSREELEEAAGGPRWSRIRSRLLLLFWLSWLAMLGTAVFIVVRSPRPVAPALRWFQKDVFYRLRPGQLIGGPRGIEGG